MGREEHFWPAARHVCWRSPNTSTVTITFCTESMVAVRQNRSSHWSMERDRQAQKAGRKYVSLVNTTHTETSAIPPRRFVLLPNTGWENQVTGGWELVLFIRDSNLNSQGNYSLQRHSSQMSPCSILTSRAHIKLPHGKVWLGYTEQPVQDYRAT